MSYIKKIEYEVVPQESFSVIRNCPGCGVKTNYRNTKRFRVNANGNRLDVWLIYQCEKCKHALNRTVYERQKAAIIPKDEYQHFLSNDEETAEKYGMNFDFFRKNKADVDMDDITYRYIKLQESSSGPADKIACHEQTLIHIQNPYGLKIRPEKQIAEVLELSRSQVVKLLDRKAITIESISSKNISFCVKATP